MRNNKWNYKKLTAAVLAGAMLSLATVSSAFAANGNIGPGTEAAKRAEEEAKKLQDTPGYWVQNGDSWYFYNPDGSPCSGWIKYKQKHYCLDSNGLMYANTITPDGYFVDAGGEWYERKTEILSQEFTAPDKFPEAFASWENVEQLAKLRNQIRAVFKERRLKVSSNAIEYVVDSNNKEQVLMGVYKLNETGSIRMDIGISLDASSVETDEPETYDYMVFRAMMYEITSAPDHLEKAIYSSWEESNSWNIGRDYWVWIGDSWVRYGASSGYGQYELYPVEP